MEFFRSNQKIIIILILMSFVAWQLVAVFALR